MDFLYNLLPKRVQNISSYMVSITLAITKIIVNYYYHWRLIIFSLYFVNVPVILRSVGLFSFIPRFSTGLIALFMVPIITQ